MKASSLLQTLAPAERRGPSTDPDITKICFDSRQLIAGCLFVAVRGTKSDGHAFVNEAARQGAAVIVVEEWPTEAVPAIVVKVSNSRQALHRLAETYFGTPSKELFCIGVTGTNGKTTTTHMIEQILNLHGSLTGVIGTINHHLGARVWETELTTPDALSFQERLRQFVDGGAKALAMEVSSIGLEQNRTGDLPFDVAVFTNLSRDHLDYHKNFEEYFQAKRILFADLLRKSTKPQPWAIINADDEYGRRLLAEKLTAQWSYGAGPECDLRYEILEQEFSRTRFVVHAPMGRQEFTLAMAGLHNVYNALGAIGAALRAGASLATCAKALASLGGVKGRLEAVENKKNLHVFVDYAHTDGALETVLHYLNLIKKQIVARDPGRASCRLITVIGWGGDRDKGKRPLMMKAAERGSDVVVLTSDNPRTEDPQAILNDALKGLEDQSALDTRVFAVVDRREGIRRAIEIAKPGDVVLIAGKGHEDYQQIGTKKFPFSDVEVVKEVLV